VTFFLLVFFYFLYFVFFSRNRVTAERSVAQTCVMAQTTRFDVRTCLFGVSLMYACTKGSRGGRLVSFVGGDVSESCRGAAPREHAISTAVFFHFSVVGAKRGRGPAGRGACRSERVSWPARQAADLRPHRTSRKPFPFTRSSTSAVPAPTAAVDDRRAINRISNARPPAPHVKTPRSLPPNARRRLPTPYLAPLKSSTASEVHRMRSPAFVTSRAGTDDANGYTDYGFP
jgi:hypothetical protein